MMISVYSISTINSMVKRSHLAARINSARSAEVRSPPLCVLIGATEDVSDLLMFPPIARVPLIILVRSTGAMCTFFLVQLMPY